MELDHGIGAWNRIMCNQLNNINLIGNGKELTRSFGHLFNIYDDIYWTFIGTVREIFGCLFGMLMRNECNAFGSIEKLEKEKNYVKMHCIHWNDL